MDSVRRKRQGSHRNTSRSTNWTRCGPGSPCLICEHSDWCGYTEDGAHRCMRVHEDECPDGFIVVRPQDKEGGTVFRKSARIQTRKGKVRTKRKKKRTKRKKTASRKLRPTAEARKLFERLLSSKGSLRPWARRYQTSAKVLKEYGCAAQGKKFYIPERSASGALLGVCKRPEKRSVLGSKRHGIIRPKRLPRSVRLLVICEGGTDPMAVRARLVRSKSCLVIGRPSKNQGSLEEVVALILRVRAKNVVIVADADDTGASQFAENLARNAGVRVRWFCPPAKDAREWIRDGATPDDFEAAVEDAEVIEPTRFRLESVDELLRHKPPVWQVKGMIPVGSVQLIYAPRKAFKSFTALHYAACVASGADFAGRAVERAFVVYGCAEGAGGLPQRVGALRYGYPTWNLDRLKLLRARPQISDPRQMCDLLEAIAALPEPPGLIILDTLARVSSGLEEVSGLDMGESIDAIEHIRETTGATVLVIHHEGKTRGRGARGHSSLEAAVDGVWHLKKVGRMSALLEGEAFKDVEHVDGFRFEFAAIDTGLVDADGDSISSLYAKCVEPIAAVASDKRRTVFDNDTKALKVLEQLITKSNDPLGVRATAWATAVKAEHGFDLRHPRERLQKLGRVQCEKGAANASWYRIAENGKEVGHE